ncbi:MAG: hypothetical protein ACK45A_20790, partial [Planctomyces sp.]
MKVAIRDFIPGAAIATLRRFTLRAIILAGMFSSPLLTAVRAQTDLPWEPKSQPQVPETLLKRSISIAKEELQNRPNPAKPFRWHGELSHPGLPQTPEPIPPERTRPRQKFAVCVGIDRYAEGPSRDLHYAAADAAAMAEACLKNLQFTKVLLIADIREVPENLRTYIDTGRLVFTGNTTADAIEGELEKFARLAVGSDDVLAYYHAGHGDSGRTPALLAGDHTPNAPRRITVNAIIDRLQADEVFAAHRLVILDVCRSGLNNSAGRVMSAAFREAFSRPDLRMTVLTGCDSQQSSSEDPALGHGRFTWALLQGIQGQAWRAGEQALLSSDLYIQIAGLFGTKGWNTEQSPQQFQSGSVFALAWRDLPLPQQLDEFEQQKLKEDIESATKTYLSVLTPTHREKARSQCRYAIRATDLVQLEDPQTMASRARLLELYAVIEYRLGNHESVDKWLTEAELLNPGNTTQSLVAAFRQADEGRVVEASDQLEPLLERLAETAKDDIWLWQRIAGIQAAVGDSLGAIVSYGRAAEAVHRLQSDSQLRYDLLWQNLDRQEELTNAIWFELPFTNRIDWLLRADEVALQTVARTLGPSHGETKNLQWRLNAHHRLTQLPSERLQAFLERNLLYSRFDESGRHTDASRFIQENMAAANNFLDVNHPWRINIVYRAGITNLALENTAAAIANLQTALHAHKNAFIAESRQVALCHFELGKAYQAAEKRQKAIDCFHESARIYAAIRDPDMAISSIRTAEELTYHYEDFGRETMGLIKPMIQPAGFAGGELHALTSDLVELPRVANRLFSRGIYDKLKSRWIHAIEHFSKAESAYRETDDSSTSMAWMAVWQGECWASLNDEENVIESQRRALAMFRDAGPAGTEGLAATGAALARRLVELHRLDQAESIVVEVITACEKLGKKAEAAEILSQVGDCWRGKDDAKAIETYMKAADLFRAAGEEGLSGLAETGSNLHDLKRSVESEHMFAEVIAAYEKLGKNTAAARILSQVGDCWRGEDNAKAIETYMKAADLFRAAGEEGLSGLAKTGSNLHLLKRC